MAQTMVPSSRTPANNRFKILDEASLEACPPRPRAQGEDLLRDAEGVLVELPIDHPKNQCELSRRGQPRSHHSALTHAKSDKLSPRAAGRGSRRRPTLEPDTFEPLASVDEEDIFLHKAGHSWPIEQQRPTLSSYNESTHPLASATASPDITNPIEKQLAGQFEWLISYPASALTAVEYHGDSLPESQDPGAGQAIIFGCNLLRRKPKSPATSTQPEDSETDTFTFIATPLPLRSPAPISPGRGSCRLDETMSVPQNMPTLCTPTKMASMVEAVEQMLSPPLTATSDRTASLVDAYSPLGSVVSSPRIEDSLAEIDKLEDDLEAIDLYAQSRKVGVQSDAGKGREVLVEKKPSSTKRVTIAAQPATMRIKSSEKIKPVLRRSSSLTLRNRQTEPLEDIPEQKVPGSMRRSKSTTLRPPTLSRATVKSAKAPTIPNFELPGEAISRRLKEQREARQAQQAEAQKPPAAPPRPRSQKPLTKPNFELPGEAISRRKREQHKAKIRAEEEEERKKREFKARPIRYSIGPSTLPRDTITSRARQHKEPVVESEDIPSDANALHAPGRIYHTLSRGRNSVILPTDTGSRATSASAASVGGQRSSLSAEDAAQQRMRGREIFTRDNSFTTMRQKEKREKETIAQLARAEAAERSRALSREWAEKKRRKELSLRQAMRASLHSENTD